VTAQEAAHIYLDATHEWVLWPNGALVSLSKQGRDRATLIARAKYDLDAFNPKTCQQDAVNICVADITVALNCCRHVYLVDFGVEGNVYALLIPHKKAKNGNQEATLGFIGLAAIEAAQKMPDEILATSADPDGFVPVLTEEDTD